MLQAAKRYEILDFLLQATQTQDSATKTKWLKQKMTLCRSLNDISVHQLLADMSLQTKQNKISNRLGWLNPKGVRDNYDDNYVALNW